MELARQVDNQRKSPKDVSARDCILLPTEAHSICFVLSATAQLTKRCKCTLKICILQDMVESCSRPREFKALLFSLCYFHALIIGRKKFGFLGWSRSYSFNEGDLTICGNVIRNYLDK